MAKLATWNESQIRQAKSLGLALIFLPLEYLYFFGPPGFFYASWPFGALVIIGTIIFLLSYAMGSREQSG